MNVGDNIKKYRIFRDFTRRDLANELQVSESTISRYENNKREPNINTLNKIAKILGIPATFLMDDETLNHNLVQRTTDMYLDKIQENTDKNFPTLAPIIELLTNPKIEMVYNFTYTDLAQNGYEELMFIAIEKAIKDTLQLIKNHENNGDIFDGAGAWISKESPLYEILKKNQNNNQPEYALAAHDGNLDDETKKKNLEKVEGMFKEDKKELTYDDFDTVAAHNDNLTDAEIWEADRRILEDINKKNNPST
ncbi:MAG: Transcriptional regulator, MerR family [Clostridium butyricum DORA_1]|jgi:transcriptional regulator with XRE-family HTH domain|uniref:helix-turn-helix domain-containing protein n=1 Tax=Clostridium butyricum TaxID=1492 RepID=UPI0003D5E249|nr:MAG: Transcriptional regulator, MerR family [Clostridium butyricum DORA_1]